MNYVFLSICTLLLLRAQTLGSPVPSADGSVSSPLAEEPPFGPSRGNQPLTDYYRAFGGSGSLAPYSYYGGGTNSAINTIFVGPNNPFQSTITRLGYPTSPFIMGFPSTGFPTTGSFYPGFPSNGGVSSLTQPFLTTQQYLAYPNTMQMYPSINQQNPSMPDTNQPTPITNLGYPNPYPSVQNTNQQNQQFPGQQSNQNNQVNVFPRAPQTYPLTTGTSSLPRLTMNSNGYPTFTNPEYTFNNQFFQTSQRLNPYFPTSNPFTPRNLGFPTTTTRVNPFLSSTQRFPGTVDQTNGGGAPNIPGRNLKRDPLTGMQYLEDASTGVWMFVDNNGIPLPVKFVQEGTEVPPGALNSYIEPGDGRRVFINKMGQPLRVSTNLANNGPLNAGLLRPTNPVNPMSPVNPVAPVGPSTPQWPFQINQG